MGSKISLQTLQKAIHKLDVSSAENQQKVSTLVTLLQRSSAEEDKLILKQDNNIQSAEAAIGQSKFLSKLIKIRGEKAPDTPEYEVSIREIDTPAFTNIRDFNFGNVFAKADQILGPFLLDDGRNVWYDFIRYLTIGSLKFQGDSTAAIYMDIRLPKQTKTLTGRGLTQPYTDFNIAKGNVWIRANLLNTATAADNYIGFKVKSGKIKFAQGIRPASNQLTVAVANSFTLTLELDNDVTVYAHDTFGLDAKEVGISRPKTLVFNYLRSRLSLASYGGIGLKVYGDDKLFAGSTSFKNNNTENYLYLELKPQTDASFHIRNVRSRFFTIEGQADIESAQWIFGMRKLPENKALPVAFNGAMDVNLSKGLTCWWDTLTESANRIKLISPTLRLVENTIQVKDTHASYLGVQDRLLLWQTKRETTAPETFDLDAKLYFGRYQDFIYTCESRGAEYIGAKCDADFYIDKPVLSDGKLLSPKTEETIFVKGVSEEGNKIILLDTKFDQAKDKVNHNFTLENGFLTTGPVTSLILQAQYKDNNNLIAGHLTMRFDLHRLIPTLPHPYTGKVNYHSKYTFDIYRNQYTNIDYSLGTLFSICQWQETDGFKDCKVDFKLNQKLIVPDAIEKNRKADTEISKSFTEETERREAEMFRLFDLSTAYDHLGISMNFAGKSLKYLASTSNITYTEENVVSIERMNLMAPMTLLNGMTLPHVTWEPTVNLTQTTHNQDPQHPILLYQNNDHPTVFTQIDHTPIKINPLDYIQRFQQNLKPAIDTGNQYRDSQIFFSLPNGKLSLARIEQFDKRKSTFNNKHLEFVVPKFETIYGVMTGGQQFRIAAAFDPNLPTDPPKLTGLTKQLLVLKNEPGISPLGYSVHSIFNTVFASNSNNEKGVPLTHLDFSGYGAFTYSDWRRPLAKYASIAQARFDILRGRTNHEIVQAVSMIYPYGICATRTISFYRRNNSIVYREDSGWVAQSDGLFNFNVRSEGTSNVNLDSQMQFHPGLFQGVYNVRNIHEVSGDIIEIEYEQRPGDIVKTNPNDSGAIAINNGNYNSMITARFIGVTFDADVLVDGALATDAQKRVTGKRFKGYLQLMPEGIPVPPRIMAQMLQLKGGSLGGNIDCLVNIAQSGQKLKANAVDITVSYQDDNPDSEVFIGTVRGSVQLPDDGSWSMVEVGDDRAVATLGNDKNISVVRKGLRALNEESLTITNPVKETRIAFPDTLLNPAVQKSYAILQNTETQKVLFNDPYFDMDQAGRMFIESSAMADSFHLLNSKGPFPSLDNAIEILNDDGILNILPNDSGLKKAINYTLPDNYSFTILGDEDSAFRIYIQYKNEPANGQAKNTVLSYVTDSLGGGDKWKNEINNISLHVDLGMFKPLMTVTGDFNAKATAKPSLDKGIGAQIKFNPLLEKIYQILEFLNELNMTQPVEAVAKGLKIAMSNSAYSWEYKFKAEKEIPLVRFPFDPINYNAPTTPLKLDAYFKIGCYFNQTIVIPSNLQLPPGTIEQMKPSIGAFVELGADLRVMCVSLAAATVYAVGRAELGLSADLNNAPQLYFKFGFGVELAVGLPVVGSVAVMYMVGIDMSISNQVDISAFIYFRGRAEVFGGIVTITIAIEAKGGINKIGNGPTNIIASCTFALDISIAFVININFTRTWEEKRQIA